MRKVLTVLAALVLSTAAQAQEPAASKPLNAQQSKMATCNGQAGDRKGDERKAFMSSCLSAKAETPQERMKRCNGEATGKTGDERKAFMSECLKAS